MKQVTLKIIGRVQGVFYRSETQDKAISLGLKGWVKNNADDSVTVLAQGQEDKLREFISWCWEGPSLAAVEKIEERWQEPKEHFADFKIVY